MGWPWKPRTKHRHLPSEAPSMRRAHSDHTERGTKGMRMARHGSMTRVSREVSVGLNNTLDKSNHLPARRKALRSKLEHAVEAISMGRACRREMHAARAAQSPAAPGGTRAQCTPRTTTALRRTLSQHPDRRIRPPAPRQRRAHVDARQVFAHLRSACMSTGEGFRRRQ